MRHTAIARSAVIAITILTCATSGVAQQNPSEVDAAAVLETARPLAENGNANAQYNMGVLYDEGYGVEQDHAKAREWYEKAAAQDFAKAEHNLGIMYQSGRGVEKDYAQAAEWFKRAADHGEPAAQNNLAVLYARGEGVDRNMVAAVKLTARAAAADNSAAKNNLPQLIQRLKQSRIDGDNVNIRSQPNTSAGVLRKADRDTRVAVLDTREDWAQVVFDDDYTVGWVADFLLAEDSAASGDADPAAQASVDDASADNEVAQASADNDEAAAQQPADNGDSDDSDDSDASGDSGDSGTAQQGEAETEPTRYIGGDAVNVRSGPSTNDSVRFQAWSNERVTVTGRENDWRRIRFDDGRTGWVAAFLLTE